MIAEGMPSQGVWGSPQHSEVQSNIPIDVSYHSSQAGPTHAGQLIAPQHRRSPLLLRRLTRLPHYRDTIVTKKLVISRSFGGRPASALA